MHAKLLTVLLFLLLFRPAVQARDTDLEFLVEKIKLDYPVFREKTRHINFDSFVTRTIAANSDTFRAMALIVDFFKDRHLDLVRTRAASPVDTALCQAGYQDVMRYFGRQQRLQRYEGFWVNDYNNCIIALKQEGRRPLAYRGYVIASRDSSILRPGMTALDFEQDAAGAYFGMFVSGYTGSRFYVTTQFRSDTLFTTGANSKWRRLPHFDPGLLRNLPVFDKRVRGGLLDADNYLVVLPGNTEDNTLLADSIVRRDYKKIAGAKNLIIDLRNNLGGTIRTYFPLMPFIYTGPIARTDGDVYCTEDGIRNEEESLAAYCRQGAVDSGQLKAWKVLIEEKKTKIGSFVSGYTDTLFYDSVMRKPQQVGIIINYACQSAAEMMLLECRQSKKVTLFGEHTMGAIDQLNYFPIPLPSGKYRLMMATGKRKIPPGGAPIDGRGIYPDVPISDAEPDWIQFVKTYYEKY